MLVSYQSFFYLTSLCFPMVQFIVSSHASPLCHCHIVVGSLYEHTVTFDAAETFKQSLSRSKLFKVDCVPSFLLFK